MPDSITHPLRKGAYVRVLDERAHVLELRHNTAVLKFDSGERAEVPIYLLNPILEGPDPSDWKLPDLPKPKRFTEWVFGRRFERLAFLILGVLAAGAILTYYGFLPK